ncbi:hypothetical protein DKG34_37430 [Streptomyces sp. NWU49]|uniref:hypothetical protein n=1 Tax=Streptomyces sp. NWU49 TaxID=2201153 RepID=UPI000D674B37|nr:hypothetical protein [Streptomyces sp. NWU49]PWJ02635.1 hypothetical protein DKG34_37430 [Streptomyces sp. NWU49]
MKTITHLHRAAAVLGVLTAAVLPAASAHAALNAPTPAGQFCPDGNPSALVGKKLLPGSSSRPVVDTVGQVVDPVRVAGQNDMLPHDHAPERLTLLVDESQRVVRAFCG